MPVIDPADFDRDTPVDAAFAGIVASCADQILRNAAILQSDSVTEALHQMRIGIRKLRTALKVFGPELETGASEELGAELRWLQDETGPSRDWHTYIEQSLVKLQPYVHSSELALLETLARAQLSSAQERYSRVLREERFAALLHLLQDWRRDAEKLIFPVGDCLRDYARHVLKRCRKKVQADHERMTELDLLQLHKLRIRVKDLRYSTELFATLGKRREVKTYVRELKNLQHRLGTIHDAVVAQDLTAELRRNAGVRDHAAGLVQGWSAAIIERERDALLRAGTRVRKVPL